MRQLCDACFGRGADTAVDSHKRRCPRAGGLEEPTFPHPFTRHNWMQCGALRHGGLDGTGRKMDEVSSTFTSAAPLNADCVDTGISHSSHSAHTYYNSELTHLYRTPNMEGNIQRHKFMPLLPFGFITCLCKLTETQLQYFFLNITEPQYSISNEECVLF